MSCFESLLSKIIHLPKSPLEGCVHSRSVLECQFLYFLALSKHTTQTCWYKRERNNCMWWLSTFSLLVTENCEGSSQSSSMWWASRVWGEPGLLSSRVQGTRETFRSVLARPALSLKCRLPSCGARRVENGICIPPSFSSSKPGPPKPTPRLFFIILSVKMPPLWQVPRVPAGTYFS